MSESAQEVTTANYFKTMKDLPGFAGAPSFRPTTWGTVGQPVSLPDGLSSSAYQRRRFDARRSACAGNFAEKALWHYLAA